MELSLQNFCRTFSLSLWASSRWRPSCSSCLDPVQVCNNRIIKTKLKQQKNLILLLFHFVFNITCSAAGAGFRHFFSCSLLELLVPVWIPAKRQIIFESELSENSVKNARKTADFGIELSENFNRWPGPTLLCLHSLVHGLSEPKGFSPISHREKKWIGKESESENRAILTEFARNSRVFFFSNSFFFPMSYRAESFWFG